MAKDDKNNQGGGQDFGDVPVHTSTSLAKQREAAKTTDMVVIEELSKRRKTLSKLLTGIMDSAKFQTVALTTIRTNEKLRQCSPVSLVTAVMMAAQRGLSLDPTLGHAYLVPYKGEAQYQTGYQGKIFLAKRDGDVIVDTFVVYENDQFTIRRTPAGNEYEHVPAPLTEDPGEAIGWVARAVFPDGRTVWEVMRKAEVEKIRDTVRARYGKDTPAWREHFDEMGRGKVVNRLAKYLPQCPSLQFDAAQEAALDRGGVVIDVTPDSGDGAPEPIVVPVAEAEGAKPQGTAQAPAGAAIGGDPPKDSGATGTAASGAPGASGGVASSRGALGRYVRQMREGAGVTAESMAGALGLEPAMIQKLEAGEVLFTEATATAAAKFLALDPADLLAIGGLDGGERGKGKGAQKALFGKGGK